jgi:hypothetical protein
MRFAIVGCVVLVVLGLAALVVYNPVFELYYLPQDLEPGLLFVEYDNDECEALGGIGRVRTLSIPPDGYLCSSSASLDGYIVRMYLTESEDGETALAEASNIVHWMSFDEQMFPGPCKVSGTVFWYQKRPENKNQELQDRIEGQHPECIMGRKRGG